MAEPSSLRMIANRSSAAWLSVLRTLRRRSSLASKQTLSLVIHVPGLGVNSPKAYRNCWTITKTFSKVCPNERSKFSSHGA